MSEEINNNTPAEQEAPAPAPAEKIDASETAAKVAQLDLDSDEDIFDNMQFPEPDYNAPPAVEFHDVVKRYYLYKSEKSRFKAMFTGNRGVPQHQALNGLDFTIYPGESVGFIGRNGGNKFVAIFRDCTETRLERFLDSVESLTEERNTLHEDARIRYSAGKAFNEGEDISTVTELVALSDKRARQAQNK